MIEEILLAASIALIVFLAAIGVLAAASACILSSRISKQEETHDEKI